MANPAAPDDDIVYQAERNGALASAVLHAFAAAALPVLLGDTYAVRAVNLWAFVIIELSLALLSLIAFFQADRFRERTFRRLKTFESVLTACNYGALAWLGPDVVTDSASKYLLCVTLVALTSIAALNNATFARRRVSFVRTVGIVGGSHFVAYVLAGELLLAGFTVVWCLTISGFSKVGYDAMRELAELRRLSDETARHDDLTELLNRSAFVDELQRAADAGERRALVLLDLDGFKAINDGFGHGAGDAVLRAVSDRLRQSFPAGSALGRLGGDEFAALLPVSDGTEVQTSVEDALAMIAAAIPYASGDLYVAGSAGWTHVTERASAAVLMAEADAAMYESKNSPTTVTTGFDPGMRDALDRALELRQRFRGAIRAGRIEFLAQPVVRPYDRSPLAVELLARWPADDAVTIGPAEFNRLADETGLAVELDRLALAAAAELLSSWRDEPLLWPLVVKVNVSPLHLHNLVLERTIEELIPPGDRHRLGLEFIEDRLMAVAPRHHDLLRRLKAMGVTISVDDFGTGYSSLSYLRELPVSEVKIDRSFMTDIAHDRINQGLVRAIVELTATLGLTTVAEGIETDAALQAVSGLGVSAVQGYETGRPGTFERVTERLLEALQTQGSHTPVRPRSRP